MALQLQKQLNNGITADYWRIIRVNNQKRGFTEVTIGLFRDSGINDNGVLDTRAFQYVINGAIFETGNVYQTIYELIKLEEEFADAIDC
jgi:hypothetical protein